MCREHIEYLQKEKLRIFSSLHSVDFFNIYINLMSYVLARIFSHYFLYLTYQEHTFSSFHDDAFYIHFIRPMNSRIFSSLFQSENASARRVLAEMSARGVPSREARPPPLATGFVVGSPAFGEAEAGLPPRSAYMTSRRPRSLSKVRRVNIYIRKIFSHCPTRLLRQLL